MRQLEAFVAVAIELHFGRAEQYYRRAFASLTYDDAVTTEAAFRALAAEIAAAQPDPFLVLRDLRLSPEHAQRLTATLHDLAEQADDGGDHPRYGLLLGLYQPALEDPGGQPPVEGSRLPRRA